MSSAPSEWCRTAKYLELKETTGYIASVFTEETGCGSHQSPWIIVGRPGQKINITLYDFGLSSVMNMSSSSGISSKSTNRKHNGERASSHSSHLGKSQHNQESVHYPVYCQQYAKIEEKSIQRSTIVCGGDRREKNIYISLTNEVEIQIMNRKAMGRPQYFMLRYKGRTHNI